MGGGQQPHFSLLFARISLQYHGDSCVGQEMVVDVTRLGPVALVELPAALSQKTLEAWDETLDLAGVPSLQAVIFSLRQIEKINSEGIRCLVLLHDEVMGADKAFHVAELRPDIRYALKIAEMLEFLSFVESLDDLLHRYGVKRDGPA